MEKHFTATAFVINSQNQTLLLWHKHLQRWMPPGGHVDPNEIPEETARRECLEETGLEVDIVGDAHSDLFADNPSEGRMIKRPIAMLLENIPPHPVKGGEPHQHMDFLYVARPIDETQTVTPEAPDIEWGWFSREQVKALDADTEIFANVKAYILEALT